MTRRYGLLAVLMAVVCLTALACGRGGNSLKLADAATLTTDTLTVLLIGEPEETTVLRQAPVDKPLLEKGVFDAVIVTLDIPGFVEATKGGLKSGDLELVRKQVVQELDRRLKRKGFSATAGEFPVTAPPAKTLVALLAPKTEQTGSPDERAQGKGRAIVLVRLSVTDPTSNTILAQREYFSGAEVDPRKPKSK